MAAHCLRGPQPLLAPPREMRAAQPPPMVPCDGRCDSRLGWALRRGAAGAARLDFIWRTPAYARDAAVPLLMIRVILGDADASFDATRRLSSASACSRRK